MMATQNLCVVKGQGTVSYVTAKRWFKRFRNGEFSLQDDLRSGRPMEIDLPELKHVLESGSDQISRNIASQLGCIQKVIHYLFKQVGLVTKLGQWEPHDLTLDQTKNVSTAHSE